MWELVLSAGGMMAVIVVLFRTSTFVEALLSVETSSFSPGTNPVPVIVTGVPPITGPEFGVTAVTVRGAVGAGVGAGSGPGGAGVGSGSTSSAESPSSVTVRGPVGAGVGAAAGARVRAGDGVSVGPVEGLPPQALRSSAKATANMRMVMVAFRRSGAGNA